MRLRELGEDRLLRRVLPRLALNCAVVAGAGDDCAVVEFEGAEKFLLLKTDSVVEGVHFTASASPRAVGWKAMARPLSDFAAVSGVPRFALIAFIAPAASSAGWMTQMYQGLNKAARAFDVAIVGGETSETSGPVSIVVSVAGAVEKERWVSRRGGRAGDALFVTGRLGGSIRGRHLRFMPRIAEARWLTKHFGIHAMMDLSDGLGVDLPRLARASRVGFELNEDAIPRNRGCTIQQAIGDGEDYELLFAISSNQSDDLQRKWKKKFPKLPLTGIGEFLQPSPFNPQPFPGGYVHFK